MTNDKDLAWIESVRAQGWGSLAGAVLHALRPLAPLGAQLIWTAQPALGLLVRRDTLGALARALEQPEGVDGLCRLLEDGPPSAE